MSVSADPVHWDLSAHFSVILRMQSWHCHIGCCTSSAGTAGIPAVRSCCCAVAVGFLQRYVDAVSRDSTSMPQRGKLLPVCQWLREL